MIPDIVAFYLPQYYPTPENDTFVHPGFSEWTALATARELFRGHELPVPGELGFYDLRLPETRIRQAELARTAGVAAFCYWHYWFGNGRVTLDRPINEVIDSKEPDLPFCLGWANHSWGDPARRHQRINIEQHYPKGDPEAHYRHVYPILSDPRYYRVDGKLLFYIFKPELHPDLPGFCATWRQLAHQDGLGEMLFVGPAPNHGCDVTALPVGPPYEAIPKWRRHVPRWLHRPIRVPYSAAMDAWAARQDKHPEAWPLVMPNWDHSPRINWRASILVDTDPDLFRQHLAATLRRSAERNHRVVFLKSWNEWGEGNYVEPDRKHGRAWIDAIAAARADASRATSRPSATALSP